MNRAAHRDKQIVLLKGLIGVINNKLQEALSDNEAFGNYLFCVESTDETVLGFADTRLMKLLSEIYPGFSISCWSRAGMMMVAFELFELVE